MKKVLPIIIALILAAVASIGIVQWSKQLSARGQSLSVVVAAHNLPAGHKLAQNDMEKAVINYPAGTSRAREFWDFVFTDLTDPANMGTLEGRELSREVLKGRPILITMLKPIRRKRSVINWRMQIAKGKRAIAIPVQSIAAVAGLVDVGDHVDVLATLPVPPEDDGSDRVIRMPVKMGDAYQNVDVPYESQAPGESTTFFLMQDVEILAVGDTTDRPEALDEMDESVETLTHRRKGSGSITVALTPEQVLLFAFAITNGSSQFTLALRRPGDTLIVDLENIKPATLDTVLEAVGAKR